MSEDKLWLQRGETSLKVDDSRRRSGGTCLMIVCSYFIRRVQCNDGDWKRVSIFSLLVVAQ